MGTFQNEFYRAGFDYHVCDLFGEEVMDKHNLIIKIIEEYSIEKVYESESEDIKNAPYLLIKLHDPDERFEIMGNLSLESKLKELLIGIEDYEFLRDSEMDDGFYDDEPLWKNSFGFLFSQDNYTNIENFLGCKFQLYIRWIINQNTTP